MSNIIMMKIYNNNNDDNDITSIIVAVKSQTNMDFPSKSFCFVGVVCMCVMVDPLKAEQTLRNFVIQSTKP